MHLNLVKLTRSISLNAHNIQQTLNNLLDIEPLGMYSNRAHYLYTFDVAHRTASAHLIKNLLGHDSTVLHMKKNKTYEDKALSNKTVSTHFI